MTRGLDRGVLTHRGKGGVTAAGQTGRKGVGVSWEESLIWEGNRVVVVSGAGPESRDRWRIGQVVEVRRGTRQVVVEGLNEVRGSFFVLVFGVGSVGGCGFFHLVFGLEPVGGCGFLFLADKGCVGFGVTTFLRFLLTFT